MDILLTWVGARDPFRERTGNTPGPILSLLAAKRFDAMYLLCNPREDVKPSFYARATEVTRYCQLHFHHITVRQKPIDLVSVTDHREIFHATNQICQQIIEEEGSENRRFFIFLSPGTPQMQTVWVLLVRSGLLDATMLEATPPELVSPGGQIWREVDLSFTDLPTIVSPGKLARELASIQAQNENLSASNRRLTAEIGLLQTGAASLTDSDIPENFSLPKFLDAQEYAHYEKATRQARGHATEAARLLGIAAPTFRARAQTLGVRTRKRRQSKAP